MRVALVGYPLLAERQWNLCLEFERRGVETHLVVPEDWPTIPRDDHPPADAPFTVHRHRAVFYGHMARYWLPGAVRSLAGIDPDVVLTHGEPWYAVTATTQVICSALGIPHGVFTWENLSRVPRSRVQRAIERATLAGTNGVLAGSDAAEQRIRKRGYGGTVAVAPETGVDTETFTPEGSALDLQERFGVPDDTEVVLYAGRLAAEKGLKTLLDAVRAVLGEAESAHFLIVGEGPLAAVLERRIEEEGLRGVVTVVSERQPYEVMPALYRSATVFVYPSESTEGWAEQFGYSVAEAMSCGLPVVVSDCGSLPFVVGDGGVTVAEGNAVSLGNALAELLNDAMLRKEHGERAHDRVRRTFSLDEVAGTQLRFFERVS